jgi:hypothetical protein
MSERPVTEVSICQAVTLLLAVIISGIIFGNISNVSDFGEECGYSGLFFNPVIENAEKAQKGIRTSVSSGS